MKEQRVKFWLENFSKHLNFMYKVFEDDYRNESSKKTMLLAHTRALEATINMLKDEIEE